MIFDRAYPDTGLFKQTLRQLDRHYDQWLTDITSADDVDDILENQHDVVLAILITAVRVSHGSSWPLFRDNMRTLLEEAIATECQFPEDVR